MKPKLKEGEEICAECKGNGLIDNGWGDLPCMKCFQTGKLDWVEKVVGKRIKIGYGIVEDYGVTLSKMRNTYPKVIARQLADVQPIIIASEIPKILLKPKKKIGDKS